jgi:hypothetical protein
MKVSHYVPSSATDVVLCLLSFFCLFSGSLALLECASDMDCSLNGHCQPDGVCVCLPGWRSPQCAVLNIIPTPFKAGYHNDSYASWGGNALYDPIDGLWHMFVAEMVNHCTLNDWGVASQIIRATSASHEGPFAFADVVVAPFAHNPTVRQLPDGSGFVLFMIGGVPIEPVNCTTSRSSSNIMAKKGLRSPKAVTPKGAGGSIRVSFAPRLSGPWTAPALVNFSGVNATSWIGCGYTNPSPLILPNGTVMLAFQGGPCKDPSPFDVEMLGVAAAPSWNATFKVLNGGQPIVLPEWYCLAGFGEDPFLWYSAASDAFHMLVHGMCFAAFDSRHLFSKDGVSWTLSPHMPYSYAVNYSDAGSALYWRVERPQLIFDRRLPYGERPVALTNGVCGDGVECLSNPGMTWTLLRNIE